MSRGNGNSGGSGGTRAEGANDPPGDASVAGLAEELERSNLDVTPTPSEPPPAYTPSADPFQGEATVQYGPRRPFQQAPPPPSLLSPQGTGMPQFPGGFANQQPAPMLFIDPTGSGIGPSSGWGFVPSRRSPSFQPPLPPRHPSTISSATGSRVTSTPVLPVRPLSDFARDFYSSRREAHDENALSSDDDDDGPEPPERVPPPDRSIRAATTSGTLAYEPPSCPPPSRQFAPPSGPPPQSSSSPSRFAPPDGPPPVSARPVATGSRPADDGKPTSSPTPGRPYLNKGRVLVYPAGYECRKCKSSRCLMVMMWFLVEYLGLNTGYKHYDPSHSCKKVLLSFFLNSEIQSLMYILSAGRNIRGRMLVRWLAHPGMPRRLRLHVFSINGPSRRSDLRTSATVSRARSHHLLSLLETIPICFAHRGRHYACQEIIPVLPLRLSHLEVGAFPTGLRHPARRL